MDHCSWPNQYQVIIPKSLIHRRFSGLSISQKSTWDFAESHAESGSMNISKVPAFCRYHMISQSASMALSFSIQFVCPCKDGDSSSPMTIQFLSFHILCSKPKAPLIVPHGSTNHKSWNLFVTHLCFIGSHVSAPAMKAGQVVAVKRASPGWRYDRWLITSATSVSGSFGSCKYGFNESATRVR